MTPHGHAKDEHVRHYAGLADRLRPMLGAQELLAEPAHRGHPTALATSPPRHELAGLLKVLDADDAIDGPVAANDARHPSPTMSGAR
ncbi:hypothetical protein [Microbacterium deminutum]|uniref:Uncharacterized protein n=1 Tax=Microbacterium deminutum TaxID=344164 RepID=A0ABN2R2X3_9MICO